MKKMLMVGVGVYSWQGFLVAKQTFFASTEFDPEALNGQIVFRRIYPVGPRVLPKDLSGFTSEEDGLAGG
jgi:hypothetical protein